MRLFIILIFCAISNATFSQKFLLKQAVADHWANGFCCNSGVNYSFVYECMECEEKLKVDSVWIGNELFITGDKNCTVTYNKKMMMISVQKVREHLIKQTDSAKNSSAPDYKGEVYISGSYQGKRIVLIVEKYMQVIIPCNP